MALKRKRAQTLKFSTEIINYFKKRFQDIEKRIDSKTLDPPAKKPKL